MGTHLVDLVNWIVAPDQAVDYRTDIRLLSGERWPTPLTGDQYQSITGEPLAQDQLDYFCNNRIAYTVRGVHVDLIIRWDLELPAGDTHFAVFQGTKSRVEIRQRADRRHRAREEASTDHLFGDRGVPQESGLHAAIAEAHGAESGLALIEESGEYRVAIPAALRIGHEAHFAQVAAAFLRHLAKPRDLPSWERPNLLAKYFVTTQGAIMAPP